jgi:RNA polymerase sigma-70 factor (ECF subfamily)
MQNEPYPKEGRLEKAMVDIDIDLMRRVATGEVEAFRQLVEKYQRSLLSFFFRLTWDYQAAEDCTQEVFLKLYRSRQRYEGTAKFTTFLYRIAKNCYLDFYRRQRHPTKVVSLQEPIRWQREGKTLEELLPRRGIPTAEEILEKREMIQQFQRAIELLPEGQRLVFVMGEGQGMPYAEISDILGIPVGTVKSRMFNAVLKLRQLLGVAGLEPSPRQGGSDAREEAEAANTMKKVNRS